MLNTNCFHLCLAAIMDRLPTTAVPARPPDEVGANNPPDTLPSDTLLRGRDSIMIDHQGTRYILRATRAGKLILTK
jgi:hemin uptake protein HemP